MSYKDHIWNAHCSRRMFDMLLEQHVFQIWSGSIFNLEYSLRLLMILDHEVLMVQDHKLRLKYIYIYKKKKKKKKKSMWKSKRISKIRVDPSYWFLGNKQVHSNLTKCTCYYRLLLRKSYVTKTKDLLLVLLILLLFHTVLVCSTSLFYNNICVSGWALACPGRCFGCWSTPHARTRKK